MDRPGGEVKASGAIGCSRLGWAGDVSKARWYYAMLRGFWRARPRAAASRAAEEKIWRRHWLWAGAIFRYGTLSGRRGRRQWVREVRSRWSWQAA